MTFVERAEPAGGTIRPSSMEELFATTGVAYTGKAVLLPEPSAQPVTTPIVSADDHHVEPGDLFLRRMSSKFRDAIPQIVTGPDGLEYWQFDGQLEPNRVRTTSIVGRPQEQWTYEPVLFDEMRPGSYNPSERLRDMDRAGVIASLCFPSAMFGFAGQRFFRLKDRDLGHAAMRAYNDWVIEEWCATDLKRLIPQQVPWFPDPELAAAEIFRNAERGFKAVSFSENPEPLGFPSLYTGRWDPFFAACSETGTTINLHVGSSSQTSLPSTDSPPDVSLALFPVNAIMASVDWVYARIPTRFPDLKVVFSESGISWIPMVQERLHRNGRSQTGSNWPSQAETPEEVFRRAFWFTSIEDPCGIKNRETIGVDRIMLEVDYPHPDTTWPSTQETIASELSGLPDVDQRMLAYENACVVYNLDREQCEQIAADLIASSPATTVER